MRGDIQVLNEHLYGTTKFKVEDRATSTVNDVVKSGEILNKFGSGSGTTASASGNWAGVCIDPGANGIGHDGIDLLLGIAKEDSDETSANDGHVVAYILALGVRLKAKATTVSNMNTVALLDGLLLDCVTMDGITGKTSSTETTPYTIDENDGDDPNVHAFQILTGDIVAGTLEVFVVAATNMHGAGI